MFYTTTFSSFYDKDYQDRNLHPGLGIRSRGVGKQKHDAIPFIRLNYVKQNLRFAKHNPLNS